VRLVGTRSAKREPLRDIIMASRGKYVSDEGDVREEWRRECGG